MWCVEKKEKREMGSGCEGGDEVEAVEGEEESEFVLGEGEGGDGQRGWERQPARCMSVNTRTGGGAERPAGSKGEERVS